MYSCGALQKKRNTILHVHSFPHLSADKNLAGYRLRFQVWHLGSKPTKYHSGTSAMPSFAVHVDLLAALLVPSDEIDRRAKARHRGLEVIHRWQPQLLHHIPRREVWYGVNGNRT